MTDIAARKESAAYINKVSFHIQDNATDAGWATALPILDEADSAHRAGEYVRARALVCDAYWAAFPGAALTPAQVA